MPDSSGTDLTTERRSLLAWIAACVADEVRPPATALPLDDAATEGVLPWLAWRLHESGALEGLPAGQQERVRQELRLWGALHMRCEVELERLMQSATASGLRVIAFKGHSVARTLYPNPACRPTSDFDLLIDRRQLAAAHRWIASQGYTPLQPFVGTLWLGAQSWASDATGSMRFNVDLHWDYSNRMYFRNRLPFEALWAASQQVACGDTTLRVPCPTDDLVLACVHLAAHKPGMPVLLRWLLDIYLLMQAIGEADLALLIERAGQARAIEACLDFGERAAALGNGDRVAPVLRALRQSASDRRRRAYARTLHWRAWDLGAYWLRLPLTNKATFFGDMLRWARVRKKGDGAN